MVKDNEKLLEEINKSKFLCQKEIESKTEECIKNIQNNFGLSIEQVSILDEFFLKSHLSVIKELLEHYVLSIRGKRNGESDEFCINVPVAKTSNLLDSKQREYLIMKYFEKIRELGLDDLGIFSIKISNKFWPSARMSDSIAFDQEKYQYSYVMKVSCSVKKQLYEVGQQFVFKKN